MRLRVASSLSNSWAKEPIEAVRAALPERHCANRSLSTAEPVSAPPKWKLENGEQRSAPETRAQRTEMPEIAGQRPAPASLTRGNINDFHRPGKISQEDSNQSMHFICIAFSRRKTRAKLGHARSGELAASRDFRRRRGFRLFAGGFCADIEHLCGSVDVYPRPERSSAPARARASQMAVTGTATCASPPIHINTCA
jgi:hypothetical protein